MILPLILIHQITGRKEASQLVKTLKSALCYEIGDMRDEFLKYSKITSIGDIPIHYTSIYLGNKIFDFYKLNHS